MARPSYSFVVEGIEPKDPRFRAAGEATHRAFWRYLATEGIAVYCASRELGLDRFGVPMHPLAASTIARGRWRSHTGHGDPYGPALDPAHGESRTESLFFGRAFPDHAEFGWRVDPVTGQPWGRILHYHRVGGGHLPVRDVMGFSVEELLELARRGQSWWSAYLHGQLVRSAAERAQLPAPRIAALAERQPPKMRVVGHTDLERFTFGIGGFGVEETRRSIEAGYHSGFMQLPRRKPPGGAAAAPPRPAPAPRPQPKAAPVPLVRRPAAVAQSAVQSPGVRPAAAQPAAFAPNGPKRAPGEKIPARPAAIAPVQAGGGEPFGMVPFDLSKFAAAAKEAARATEHETFRGKAFVHDAFQQVRQQPEYFGMSLTQFKRRLVESQNARLLDMTRADLVEAMKQSDLELSHVEHNKATWNFIRF
jgi:hypothetical protein